MAAGKRLAMVMVAALLAGLAACAGGRSDWSIDTTPSVTDESVSISGTVAAGAPMIGTVEALDATGSRKQALIGADGSYRLGLKGLTLPVALRAVGFVAGHRVVLGSAATAEDLGRVVNVTPFTDLIIANIAGTSSEAFYDAPDFSRLSVALLDQARVMVTQRIAPVMTELAVATDFDLRRSAFVADHTRFDAVLDVVRVVVDPAGLKAVLSDVINATSVQDDLTRPDDHDPLPSPPSGSYARAVGELVAIDAVLGRLNTLFATAVPAAGDAALRAWFDPGFLHSGLDLDAMLSPQALLSPDSIGVRLVNPVIVTRSADGSRMRVRLQVLDTLGHAIAYDQVDSDEVEFRKDADGNWRMAGDRRMGDVSLTAVNSLNMVGGDSRRSLSFWVPGANAGVRNVGFTGPGLPPLRSIGTLGHFSGVLLGLDAGGRFVLLDDSGQGTGRTWLEDCATATSLAGCADFTSVPQGAAYTVTFYDAAGQVMGEATTLTLPAPPLPAAQAQARAAEWFARFTAWMPGSFATLSQDTPVTATWTNPSDMAYSSMQVGLRAGLQGSGTLLWQTVAGHATSATLGTWPAAAPGAAPAAWLWVDGPFDRSFAIVSSYP